MTEGDPRRCPLPEVLGAFVQGRLSTAVRRSVERHLASCDDCLFVVSETSRYLASDDESVTDEDEDPPLSRSRLLSVAAIVAALACLAGVWFGKWWRGDGLRGLRRSAAQADVRTVEGRLIDFPYRRYSALRSDASPGNAMQRIEAERLLAIEGADAATCRMRGVAALMLGNRREALSMLAAAVHRAPREPAYWSDLSAAYLDSGQFQFALTAADQALSLDSSMVEARFNRSLALQRLGFQRVAVKSCQFYLRDDPRSAWSAEVRKNRDLMLGSSPVR